MNSADRYDETGTASWYGADFHGKKTANGERYDMHALSAAHKTLPLPTLVRVTNLDNGRSIVVRVNDRGPFVKDRLIDLSKAAAQELGYLHSGTAHVRVQTLDTASPDTATITPPLAAPAAPAAPAPSATITPAIETSAAVPASQQGNIYVQLASFSSRENAERLRTSLADAFPETRLHQVQVVDRTYFRVRIGPFSDMKAIESTVVGLQKIGHNEAMVIIE